MLIDTHAHLDFEKFDDDRDEVLKRAKEAGVLKMINISCDLKTAKRGLELAEKYPEIYATVGIHPGEEVYKVIKFVKFIKKEFSKLIRSSKKIVAVGEIGLDYYWMKRPVEDQKDLFREQLKLAKEFDLPVILHCRGKGMQGMQSVQSMQGMQSVESVQYAHMAYLPHLDAYKDCFEILQQEDIKKAVWHCFAGNLEFAEKVWEAGYLTSFTGIITYPKSENLRQVVKACPLDKIMIETDCPFLAPQKYRGQRNEPAFVSEVAGEIARIKILSMDDLASILNKNTIGFFKFC